MWPTYIKYSPYLGTHGTLKQGEIKEQQNILQGFLN